MGVGFEGEEVPAVQVRCLLTDSPEETAVNQAEFPVEGSVCAVEQLVGGPVDAKLVATRSGRQQDGGGIFGLAAEVTHAVAQANMGGGCLFSTLCRCTDQTLP